MYTRQGYSNIIIQILSPKIAGYGMMNIPSNILMQINYLQKTLKNFHTNVELCLKTVSLGISLYLSNFIIFYKANGYRSVSYGNTINSLLVFKMKEFFLLKTL